MTPEQILKLRVDTLRTFKYNVERLALLLNITEVNYLGPSPELDYYVKLSNTGVIFSKQFLTSVPYEAIVYAFAHSILYFQLQHRKRGRNVIASKQDETIWMIASEITRTSFLKQVMDTHRIPPPDAKLFLSPEIFRFPPNRSVEEYYFALQKMQSMKFASHFIDDDLDEDSQQGKGRGATDILSDEAGEKTDEEALQDEIHQSATTESLIDMVIKGAIRGLFSGEGEVQYFYEKMSPDKFNKISRLRNLMKMKLGSGPHKIANGSRPNRRAISDISTLELRKQAVKKVAAIIDVSASTEQERDSLYQQLALIINASRQVDIYAGDTEVLKSYINVRHSKQVSALPCGCGTSMKNIMEELDAKGIYHTIFVITDGFTDWPEKRLKADSFVCLLGNPINEEGIPLWLKKV